LFEFLQETKNSKYEISWGKLNIDESAPYQPSLNASIHERKLIKAGRTFFCSELVAKAYKIIKVLETNVASARFYPSSFTSENDDKLKLKKGIELEKEK